MSAVPSSSCGSRRDAALSSSPGRGEEVLSQAFEDKCSEVLCAETPPTSRAQRVYQFGLAFCQELRRCRIALDEAAWRVLYERLDRWVCQAQLGEDG